MSSAPAAIDPFDLEIISSALVAIGEEMFVTTQRTSQSTIVYEVLDFTVGLTDAEGRLVTQGNGVTLFLFTLSDAVREVRSRYPESEIRDGDIFILNDPFVGGGTHLSDVTIVKPVLHEGELIAFAANKAHWPEVGGNQAGSVSATATEVYQEGLQLPCLKLSDTGTENSAIIDIIRANVRLPDAAIGDMRAQIASVSLAADRIQELAERYGQPLLHAAVETMMEHGAATARQGLESVPKGKYFAEDWLEGAGDPVPIKVEVTVDDEGFHCDFTGTSPQVLVSTNCSRTGLISAARVAYKALVDPDSPLTDGTFAQLTVTCPDGTVFTAQRPAAVSLYWEVLGRAVDLVWHALAEVVPDRATAGHFDSTCADLISGLHPETGELFILFEPNAGGWGAGPGKDGERGLVNIVDGETYMIPAEVAEAKYGVIMEEYRLDPTDGGAGQWRGGEGVVRTYRLTSTEGQASGMAERHIYPPWGAAGGHPGSLNDITIIRVDGTVESAVMTTTSIFEGDRVVIKSGTGGGWGNPLDRDPELVARDVRDEFVGIDDARETYGVLVDPETHDVVGTTEARQAR
jgi:N-methylhydantoinase B